MTRPTTGRPAATGPGGRARAETRRPGAAAITRPAVAAPALAAILLAAPFLVAARLAAQSSDPLAGSVRGAPAGMENELAGATSPYLRSAAHQPVAWQEWGAGAFALARELDRPIWLDVGAIWCHWCHVMDRETYENTELARLINERFVPVKVDRDERPDIDGRYQMAHQALTGRPGGWPLTMFLTPDGTPFAGGTYFPPETREGVPGVRDIVPRVAQAFADDRGEIEEVARKLKDQLARFASAEGAEGALDPGLPRAIAAAVTARFDREYGGLGDGPGTKFPNGEAIRLALAVGFLEGDAAAVDGALHTLAAYAESGLRDHVLGGFFRYSTDRELTVPHFEKMDYVQAALVQAYLDAYRMTGEERWADVARDVMRYVDASLSDTERGGFFPHQDADVSLDDDGSYYTWSVQQIDAAASPGEARALRLHFGVEAKGEMPEHPAQNVLRVARTPEEVAAELGIGVEEARSRIRSGLLKLERARRDVDAPFVERTVYTSRNAMLISAYLDAWEALGDAGAREFALRSLERVVERNVREDGTVHHAHGLGESPVEGTLEDYALLADALLDAYQAAGAERFLRTAKTVMDRAVALLWDDAAGGFFDRPAGAPAHGLLEARRKEYMDAPQPGPNAVAARALEKLYLLTSEDRWRDLARRTIEAFAGDAAGRGAFAATFALAALTHLDKPAQTVVIGPGGDPLTERLATAARRTYRPGRLVTTYDPDTVDLDELPEAVAGAARAFRGDPRPRAYVCIGQTCAPPTSSPEDVVELVRDYGRVGAR